MKKTLESLFVVVAMFLAISCTKDEANPFGTIFGTVTDSQTMEPIQGAKVTLTPSGKSTVTGNDGTYELVDLEAGSYKITVQASGYQSTLKNITVLAGERALGDVSLQPTAKNSSVGVDKDMITFSKGNFVQTLMVQNLGNAGSLEWTISGVPAWASVSPTQGITDVGKSSAVQISVDASLTENRSAVIIVNAKGESVPVTLLVDVDGTGGGNESGDDPDEPSVSGDVTSGLYVYYKFEGDFNDAVNGVNGFGSNGPEFVEGVKSGTKAVKFSRTKNNYMTVPSPIIDSKAMTISFWVKDLSDGNIFYMLSSNYNQPMFSLSMSGGLLKFVVRRYNIDIKFDEMKTFSHVDLNDGLWHHIVLVSDFNKTDYGVITTVLYVDGQKMDVLIESDNPFDEDGGSFANYDTGVKFVMGGKMEDVLNGASMTIDNFRVYDTRLLSDDEIKAIYEFER